MVVESGGFLWRGSAACRGPSACRRAAVWEGWSLTCQSRLLSKCLVGCRWVGGAN